MCYACMNCGKCTGKVKDPVPGGRCPICQHQNSAQATICEACGRQLPKVPGSAYKSK